jgi:hypothetical protein
MPAMLDDPTSAPIAREVLQPALTPLIVTLKDGTTKATIIPFTSVTQVPPRLINYLWSQMSLEIEKGDTYPMSEPLPLSTFGPYWFAKFAAVMLLGEYGSVADVTAMDAAEDVEWEKVCLGTFYIKPNYPGRSSHVCNAGFIVTAASRNRGVGKLLGKAYLEWAPKLVRWVLGFFFNMFSSCDWGVKGLTGCDRVTRIRCSIWCMRPMLRRARYGIRSASKG